MEAQGDITAAEAIQKGVEWGAGAPLAPLILSYETSETHENIERNIRATLESKYQSIVSILAPEREESISICGFGPSLQKTWHALKGDILACNGAHDWLIEKGVIPKYGMFWDAGDMIPQFVKPHPDVTYLVASRCHRDVFKRLEGYNVYVWHCVGDPQMDDLLCEYMIPEPMLGHGSAAVTTSMLLTTSLGYRKLKIFGGDSSYEENGYTHVNKSIVEEQPLVVYVNGEKFLSTSWLAGQVEDFKKIGPILKDVGCSIEFYGFGLLPYVASINGFNVYVPSTT